MTVHAVITVGHGQIGRVKPDTVRCNERSGLTIPPDRTEGSHCPFDWKAMNHPAFVRMARELGFNIADIRALLTLAASRRTSCAEVKEVAGAHLASVRSKLAYLSRLETIRGTTTFIELTSFAGLPCALHAGNGTRGPGDGIP